jgi:hypothetical protein
MPVTSEKKLPVSTIRRGLVSASIWANETEHGVRYAVTLDRRYHAADGAWHSTKSFDRDSLLLAADMLREAAKFIYDAEEARRQEKRNASPEQLPTETSEEEGSGVEFTDETPF